MFALCFAHNGQPPNVARRSGKLGRGNFEIRLNERSSSVAMFLGLCAATRGLAWFIAEIYH
jgi:hypothetical protein